MKTGVILYVSGDEPSGWSETADSSLQALSREAQRVEVVSRTAGHHDIHHAWWSLAARGMHRIVCRFARFDGRGRIELEPRELRLRG